MSEPLPPLPLSSSSSSSPTIKHLVISSGGPAGHMMYSVLRTLNIKGVWDMKDIKSIYGSSIGSYIAIILALRYEWEVMDDYLIKRPWEKIFVSSSSSAAAAAAAASSIDVNDHLHLSGSSLADAKNKLGHIFQLYNTHGLYGLKEFTETLRPALQGKDMTTKITFQEFYDRTGIEVHFTVTEMNKFQAIDFSYKTHPTQSLVEACYMSCSYPFGFAPIYRDGCCYLDGGIVNDYPLHECIRDQKCGLGEILGVKVLWEKKPANITEKSSLLQFIYTFFNQINSNFYENRATKAIPNEVVCVSKVFSIRDWMNWVKDENYRRELVLRGETFANVFLSYRRNFKDSEAQAEPVPTPTPTPTSILQPSASITSLTDLAQEMAAEATATAAAEATTEEAEATEPTTMM